MVDLYKSIICCNNEEFVFTMDVLSIINGFVLGIEFYLFVSHGGMKRQRVHVLIS